MPTVEIPIGDEGEGDVVRVRVRPNDDGGPVQVGRGDRTVARASRTMERMLDTVAPVAQSFVARFRELPDPPDEMTVDFGVSLTGSADLVVATTAAEANFAVSLTWHKSHTP